MIMSTTPAQPTPAAVRSQSLDRASHRSFLADVVVEHGPRDLLGRLFIKVDTELRQRGIFVSTADCNEIKAVNAENRDKRCRPCGLRRVSRAPDSMIYLIYFREIHPNLSLPEQVNNGPFI